MTEPRTSFVLEAPAGLIRFDAECRGGKAVSIELRNQPAFCRPEDMDVTIDVPHFGRVTLDVAYGGMFYAIVDAASVGLSLEPQHGREICRLGEMVKVAAREQHPVDHPEHEYPGPDILVFREPATPMPCGGLRARSLRRAAGRRGTPRIPRARCPRTRRCGCLVR